MTHIAIQLMVDGKAVDWMEHVTDEQYREGTNAVPLNREMDNGLTQTQAADVITHLAFHAGWPNAMSAAPIAKDVFDKRPR